MNLLSREDTKKAIEEYNRGIRHGRANLIIMNIVNAYADGRLCDSNDVPKLAREMARVIMEVTGASDSERGAVCVKCSKPLPTTKGEDSLSTKTVRQILIDMIMYKVTIPDYNPDADMSINTALEGLRDLILSQPIIERPLDGRMHPQIAYGLGFMAAINKIVSELDK